jgi:hypothetical protein
MRVKGRWVVLAALVVVSVGVYVWRRTATPEARQARALSAVVERIVPDSVRIKVEVLNATNIRGLARRGTFHLRDLGFDVVSSGNSTEKFDSTVVIIRSGRPEWAELAAKALGGARIETRPDTSRYLDLTILLGASWRPPLETFHP